MLGRGTRLCKDLFGPGEDKKNVFDFCQNPEFFRRLAIASLLFRPPAEVADAARRRW
jgi:hypothetical protein